MQFVRRYPIAVPLLWVSLGIWMGDALGWGFIVFLSGAAVSWCVCVVRRIPEIAFPLLLLCSGAARLELSVTPWSPHDLRLLAPPSATLSSLRGHLLETPVTRVVAGFGKPRSFSRATLDVAEIRFDTGSWIPASGTVVVSVPAAPPPDYLAGRSFELTGVLSAPAAATTPGAFDYRSHLERQGIHFELRTSEMEDWKPISGSLAASAPLADRFQAWGRQTLSLGFPSQDPAIDLLCAMALGWKPGLDPASEDHFMKSGTMHVFAISGLHIALIALIGIECLRLAGIPRPLAGFIAVPLIWLYTGLTGWQASAIRSAVMMSVVAGGWMLDRPGNLLNNLAGAALALLCWDPQQLFQPGFQLSFCVVGHLGLFASRASDLLQGVRVVEPLLPERLQPRWRHRMDGVIQRLKPHIATSAAAWLGSAPLMAHYFHVLSPVSLLANLIVVPLSSLALASCVASLACGAFSPGIAELFNHSSWLLMHLMLKSSALAARLPGAWLYVSSPGCLGFLIYFTAIGCHLGGFFEGPNRRRRWAVGFLSGLTAIAVLRRLDAGNGCQLTLLSRRGGAMAWIDEGCGRQKWLLDPGDDREVQRVALPFLQAEGVNIIPNLVLTHASIGQMGGADTVEAAFRVYRRFVPQGSFRSPSFRRFVDDARGHGLHLEALGVPRSVGRWEVLSPAPSARAASADDAALVLLGSFEGCRILWIPKLSTRAQDQLLRDRLSAARLEADLVIAGIPAHGEPLPEPLLERIAPQWIILVDAAFPSSARATPLLRDRLHRGARRVFYCSNYPTLQLRIRDGQMDITLPSSPIVAGQAGAEP